MKARFDGGKITPDAGVLLLKEVEKRTGLIERLVGDQRSSRSIRVVKILVARGAESDAEWRVRFGIRLAMPGRTNALICAGMI